MPRKTSQPSPEYEILDGGTVRTTEVRVRIHGTGNTLSARWEQWEGACTADGSSEPTGKLPRPDFNLVLGINDPEASWDAGHDLHARTAILGATALDSRVVRGYAELLDTLADEIENARLDAEALAEHDEREYRAFVRRQNKRERAAVAKTAPSKPTTKRNGKTG